MDYLIRRFILMDMILCMTLLKNSYLSKLTYPADLLHDAYP